LPVHASTEKASFLVIIGNIFFGVEIGREFGTSFSVVIHFIFDHRGLPFRLYISVRFELRGFVELVFEDTLVSAPVIRNLSTYSGLLWHLVFVSH
jgi:hypothetical protein